MIKNEADIKEEKVEAGDGVSIKVLISSKDAPHFAMRKFRIKKGGFMPYHTNSVEHQQYVLKGSAKVIIDGKEYIAKKDDRLFIPAGVAHSYEVIGDEDYEFLCLVPNLEDRVEIVTR
jgi:quercetin dioxygenase-like cupin family protein